LVVSNPSQQFPNDFFLEAAVFNFSRCSWLLCCWSLECRYFNLPETRGLALEEIQQLFVRATDHHVLSSEDAEESTELHGDNNEEENDTRVSKGNGEEEKLINGSVM
jgi:hypothetical protein